MRAARKCGGKVDRRHWCRADVRPRPTSSRSAPDADRKVGAGDAVLAVVEGDVAGRDLELRAPRAALPFSTISLAPVGERGAVADQRARAEGAGAEELRRRDVVVRAARSVSSGKPRMSATSAGNTVSWPCPDGPARENIASRPSGSTRSSTCSLPMPPDGSRNKASPMPRSLPALLGRLPPLSKPSQSAALQRGVQQPRRIGAVIGRAGRRLQREHVLAQHVAAAQLDGIDPGRDAPPPRPAAPRDTRRSGGRRRDRPSSASCW